MSDPINPVVCDDPYLEMNGPILVLAGPGTGKTYQLARRIQTLVDDEGVDPSEITVITFTREAAQGMRAKLNDRDKAEYVEPDKQPRSIMTMHALGYRIINENAGAIGLQAGTVSIVRDKLLKAGLMRDAALLVGLDEPAGKQALRDKEQASTSASDETKQVHEQYGKILRACNAIDYDDQIAIACDILEDHADVLESYQAATRHLLIDEYQDINADQHRLIKLLSGGQEAGLFAVGDDDQSLYGFRGGNPRYIRTFHTDYPGSQVLQLQVSRRCLKNILDCALAVVTKYDSDRVSKAAPGYTESEPGLVKIWNCPSDAREAELIARAIYAKAAKGEARDFFVLVHNKNYVAPITQALSLKGIRHDVGTANTSSSDWDTLVNIKVFLDTRSNLATRHVIELILCAGTTSIPGERVKKAEKLAARAEFTGAVAKLWNHVLSGSKNLVDSLQAESASDERIQEIWGLVAAIQQTHQANATPAFLESVGQAFAVFPTIESFYKCLEFLQDTPGRLGTTKSDVRILTFRNSKGLEADCVFIVGLEEGTLPKDLADATSTAEEARLMFVAMTRAKKELHLTHVRKRTGASTYKPVSHQMNASPFIGCLPTTQCKRQFVQAAGAAKKAKVIKP
jgi:ATP-dependent DNA helicase Rep